MFKLENQIAELEAQIRDQDKKILQLILERDRYRAQALQRWALRREIEELLGFDPDATWQPAEFDKAVEKLRKLKGLK